jgi:hypothetical protein
MENLVPERLPVRYRKLSSAGSIHLVTLVFGRGNVFEQYFHVEYPPWTQRRLVETSVTAMRLKRRDTCYRLCKNRGGK